MQLLRLVLWSTLLVVLLHMALCYTSEPPGPITMVCTVYISVCIYVQTCMCLAKEYSNLYIQMYTFKHVMNSEYTVDSGHFPQSIPVKNYRSHICLRRNLHLDSPEDSRHLPLP